MCSLKNVAEKVRLQGQTESMNCWVYIWLWLAGLAPAIEWNSSFPLVAGPFPSWPVGSVGRRRRSRPAAAAAEALPSVWRAAALVLGQPLSVRGSDRGLNALEQTDVDVLAVLVGRVVFEVSSPNSLCVELGERMLVGMHLFKSKVY